jgi:uncharacterized membrane-anchored protein YitT (DUF2179 family)
MKFNNLKQWSLITIGVILGAISVEYFFAPNNIAAGGVSGLSIIINKLVPTISISAVNLVLNLILLIISFFILGKSFGNRTAITSIELSLAIWVIEAFFAPYAITEDLIIATIFGTLISALGMAIVFNNNSSTGGVDIIVKILNKFFHINIGTGILMVDCIIIFMAIIVFGVDIGLYALLSVIILGITVDRFIDGFNSCKEIMVMSSKVEEISRFIMNDLERGCTYLQGKGAFSGKEILVIYTVLGRSEFIKLKMFIKEIDMNAFISVRESYEVLGEGFREIE